MSLSAKNSGSTIIDMITLKDLLNDSNSNSNFRNILDLDLDKPRVQFTNDDVPNENKICKIFLKEVNSVLQYDQDDHKHIQEPIRYLVNINTKIRINFFQISLNLSCIVLKSIILDQKKMHLCPDPSILSVIVSRVDFYYKDVSLFDRSVSSWLENHIQSILTKFSNDIDPDNLIRWLSSKLKYGKVV